MVSGVEVITGVTGRVGIWDATAGAQEFNVNEDRSRIIKRGIFGMIARFTDPKLPGVV
jgi:hypothetical protein